MKRKPLKINRAPIKDHKFDYRPGGSFADIVPGSVFERSMDKLWGVSQNYVCLVQASP